LEGFAIAAVLHGIYDFVVLLSPIRALPVGALGILILWIWRLKLLRQMHHDAIRGTEE
jgi:hypothetical protein